METIDRDIPGQVGFPAERLARLADIEDSHFWFRGRQQVVDHLLLKYWSTDRPHVLDVGCGTASTVRRLAASGVHVIGLDGRIEGLLGARALVPRLPVAQADAAHLPVKSGSQGTVIMLDVLEHVDDRQALSEAGRVLGAGGLLVTTVPAIPALWSARDEAAGHLRRYTRTALGAVLAGAGFTVLEVRYFQCLLLPVLAATRWLGRRKLSWRDVEDRPPRLVNAALGLISRLDAALGTRIPWPLGSSLVAVCRKGPA